MCNLINNAILNLEAAHYIQNEKDVAELDKLCARILKLDIFQSGSGPFLVPGTPNIFNIEVNAMRDVQVGSHAGVTLEHVTVNAHIHPK